MHAILLLVALLPADSAAEARARAALALSARPVEPLPSKPDTTGWHWQLHSDGTVAGLMDASHRQIGGYRFADGVFMPFDGEVWGRPCEPPIPPPAKPAQRQGACAGGCGSACDCPATRGGPCPCPPSAKVNRSIMYAPSPSPEECGGST